MGVNTKAIKQRIKSVKNTKKMTKAMEMVSASKMRKSVAATLATRPYSQIGKELMEALSRGAKVDSPLLHRRPVTRMLVVLVSSNRGLCGSFNSNIFKMTAELLKDKANVTRHRASNGQVTPTSASDVETVSDFKVEILGIGKKSAAFAKKYGYALVAAFDNLGERPSFEEVLPISRFVLDSFVKKIYDKVVVVYTDYKSSLTQEVKLRQLLPISSHDLEKMLRDIVQEEQKPREINEDKYIFEPNAREIVATILPLLAEVQIYQAILESAASEHSARMVAMKNASEAAGEMIDMLTLDFNKARQAAITQEIAEIAGGAAALE